MNGKKMSSILLLAILAALPAYAIEPNTSTCKALDAWAAGLDKLPTDYDSFTALEPGQRMAVYQRLSAGQRAALWRHQMDLALASAELNDQQKAVVAEARQLMTEETYAALDPRTKAATAPQVRAAFAELKGRVAAAFPRELKVAIFYKLGPQEFTPKQGAALIPYCDCSMIDPECDCNPWRCAWNFGCGMSGGEICDGVCN
jgi:hypothetical protein